MDRRKEWKTAARLLKQGKVQAALEQLRRVSEGGLDEVITQNRLADLLAQQGNRPEAIRHYEQIARRFEDGGFAPKAIAMRKKILRLDPDQLDSAVRLGELYAAQQLQGEARRYFLHAANRYLERNDLPRAREVFERIVAVEPEDPRHRVRLAETLAAQGETRRAAEDLAVAGRELLASGRQAEARTVFERALELDGAAEGPLVGAALCAEADGDPERSLEILETAAAQAGAGPVLLGELARFYDAAGRRDQALKLLEDLTLAEVPSDTWRRLVGAALVRGDAEDLWQRLDRLLTTAPASNPPAKSVIWLQALVDIERDGHLPAVERLAHCQEQLGEVHGTIRALDMLTRAYRARSMHHRAAEVLERMRAVAPPDEEPRATGESTPREWIEQTPLEAEPTASAQPESVEPRRRSSWGDPAIPQTPQDQEFVAGRLTQAEVLEKYELLAQALEQLDEAASRFPGQLAIQERRVHLLRGLRRVDSLPAVLVELAVARHAVGDEAGASLAIEEACQHGPLGEESLVLLRRHGLEPGAKRPALTQVPAAAPAPGPVQRPAQWAAAGPAPGTTLRPGHASGEVIIELDGGEEELELQMNAPAIPEPPARQEPAAADGAAPGLASWDGDLDAIREALEQEFASEALPVAPEEPPEESVTDIVAAFRQRMAHEIEATDHRTHYDLGIGYREMGLIDEAIEELQIAAASAALRSEACAMLALCHRDRGEQREAVRWYQAALEAAAAGDPEIQRGLRYDLAELLLESGETAAALDEFRGLLGLDPAFRDVQSRVREIEERLQS